MKFCTPTSFIKSKPALTFATFLLLKSALFGQKIEFENLKYDFGQVRFNSEPTRALKFKNTGTDTLIITSIPKTACGCDMAKIKGNKMKYGPNEEGILIYTFDTQGSRRYDNMITIRTNAGHYMVRVAWEVLPKTP